MKKSYLEYLTKRRVSHKRLTTFGMLLVKISRYKNNQSLCSSIKNCDFCPNYLGGCDNKINQEVADEKE